MIDIRIQSIPPEQHRYRTTGDWTDRDGVMEVRVSEMEDWRHEFLVAIHELVEAVLCRDKVISEEIVTEFDMAYERERDAGLHAREPEPGMDERCPYRKQHMAAMSIEVKLAEMLGVSWNKYLDEIER